MMRTSQWRMRAIILLVTLMPGCHPEQFDATNAPDDSTLAISFECQFKRVAVGQTCNVHGLVLLSTGESAGAGWTADLMVSSGLLQTLGSTTGQTIIRAETGPAGEIVVPFRAPADTGYAVFTLTSHGKSIRDSLRIYQPDADVVDDPAVASIALAPSPVGVKAGDSVLVTATFFSADKKALSGRKAFFFTDDATKASVPAAAAEKVWVKGVGAGTTTLRVSRKSLLVSAPVTVSP